MRKIVIASVIVSLAVVSGCNWRAIFGRKNLADHAVEKGDVVSSVVTTASGLKYIVLKAPDANAAGVKKGDFVQAHYTGYLADANGEPLMNKKFDSSVDRNKPFAFCVGAGMVIKGWDEAFLDMKVGEERRLIIPPQLGYGARSVGDKIPANATLIFDVKLISVS